MILSDHEIEELCTKIPQGYTDHTGKVWRVSNPLIAPFTKCIEGDDIISYGLTSAGYDIRLGHHFKIYKNISGESIDPLRFKKDPDYVKRMFEDVHQPKVGGPVNIPPGGYLLGGTMEYFHIPRFLKGYCVGKSTYARCGIIVNVTPLEPEWDGYLTVEISNSSPCPATVYAGYGIAQIDFHCLFGNVQVSYKDKKGKYQGQDPVTLARVK
jgi:dCTP deaminase